MSPPSVKGEAEEDGPARARSARSSIFLMQMKGFGKVALVFGLRRWADGLFHHPSAILA